MPRLYSNEASQARGDRIVAAVLCGEPIKAIAVDNDLTEMCARKLLWARGFRAMHLSEEERNLINIRRKSAV